MEDVSHKTSVEDDMIKEIEETDWTEDPVQEDGDEHLDNSGGDPEEDDIPDLDFDVNELECVDEDVEEDKGKQTSTVHERETRDRRGTLTEKNRSSGRHHPYRSSRDSHRDRRDERASRIISPVRKNTTASPARRERDRRRKEEYLERRRHGIRKRPQVTEDLCLEDLEEVDCYDDTECESDVTSLSTPAEDRHDSIDPIATEEKGASLDDWNEANSRCSPCVFDSFDSLLDDDEFPSLVEDIDIEAVTRASLLSSVQAARPSVSSSSTRTERRPERSGTTSRHHRINEQRSSRRSLDDGRRRETHRQPPRRSHDYRLHKRDGERVRVVTTMVEGEKKSTDVRRQTETRTRTDHGRQLTGESKKSCETKNVGECSVSAKKPSPARQHVEDVPVRSVEPSTVRETVVEAAKPEVRPRERITFEVNASGSEAITPPSDKSGTRSKRGQVLPPTRDQLRKLIVRLDLRDEMVAKRKKRGLKFHRPPTVRPNRFRPKGRKFRQQIVL